MKNKLKDASNFFFTKNRLLTWRNLISDTSYTRHKSTVEVIWIPPTGIFMIMIYYIKFKVSFV